MYNTIDIIVDGKYKMIIDAKTSINIVQQIADVRDFSKRTNPSTQTFTIPANSNNDKIFKHYSNLNTGDFKTYKKLSVSIKLRGKELFSGYLQMNSSTSVLGRSEYEVTCYSTLSDITSNQNVKLSDIDWSEWDHLYTYSNVINSRDTYVINNGNKSAFRLGWGYVYPYVDNITGRLNQLAVKTEFFKPHFYTKTIWDTIYRHFGLSYESKFLNSDVFKSLINSPNMQGFLLSNNMDINLLEFKVGSDADYDMDTVLIPAYQAGSYGAFGQLSTPNRYPVLPLEQPVFDIGGNLVNSFSNPGQYYTQATKVYEVPRKMRMNFEAKIGLKGIISIWKDEFGTVINECQSNYKGMHDINVTFFAKLKYLRDGFVTTLDSNSINVAYNNKVNCNNCVETDNVDLPVSIQNYQFLTGDKVWVEIKALFKCRSFTSQDLHDCGMGFQRDQYVSTRCKLVQLAGSYFDCSVVSDEISVGDEILANKIIPDLTVSEFISSICKMFNLYILPDKDDQNLHYIEPYDDFFGSNGVINYWSDKLDRRLERRKEPLSDVASKILKLTYNDDNDFLNSKYKDKYDETFGQYVIDTDNDFKTGVQEERIKFAPSPLSNEVQTNKIITRIYKQNGTSDEEKYISQKTRILQYVEPISCDTYAIKDDDEGTFLHDKYAYAGFLDNPKTPTRDINYFFCKEYYHTTQNLVFNNLYNTYWSNYYDTLINARDIIIAYFNLDDLDIYEFSLRDLVYLDGNYYTVNRLEYSITGISIAKVELIKTNYTSLNDKLVNQKTSYYLTYANGVRRLSGNKNDNWPVTINKDSYTDFSKVKNDVRGSESTISYWSELNQLYGDRSMLSGGSSIGMGSDSTFNNLEKSIAVGDAIVIDDTLSNTIMVGDSSSASYSVNDSMLIGKYNKYEWVNSSLIVGNDITQQNVLNNSIMFGSGFTYSGPAVTGASISVTDGAIIYGTTASVYSANIVDVIESTNSIKSGNIGQVPYSNGVGLTFGTLEYITSGTNSQLSTSNLSIFSDYYSNNIDSDSKIYNVNSNTFNIFSTASGSELTVSSPTVSSINLQNTVGVGPIGSINFFESNFLRGGIDMTSSSLKLSSYLNMTFNVNTSDAFIIDYGPRVGILSTDTTTLFNIQDNGYNSNLFKISGTVSSDLLNYSNTGVMTQKGDIEITGTGSNLIIRSPDNTRWRISISNSGVISATSI